MADAKQRNASVNRTRRREATLLLLSAETDCEKNSAARPDHSGENPPSTGTIAKVVHVSSDKPAP
jgi:hypothetical protein